MRLHKQANKVNKADKDEDFARGDKPDRKQADAQGGGNRKKNDKKKVPESEAKFIVLLFDVDFFFLCLLP